MVTDEEYARLRSRVALLERQVAFLMQFAPTPFVDEMPGVDPQVAELVRQGKMLDAIRVYREKTGAGLAEAKQFVESIGKA